MSRVKYNKTLAQGMSLSEIAKNFKGSSNAAKYARNEPNDYFCGSAGGSAPTSYPITSRARVYAAIRYSRDVENQKGIIRCAINRGLEKGFITQEEYDHEVALHNLDDDSKKQQQRKSDKTHTKMVLRPIKVKQ